MTDTAMKATIRKAAKVKSTLDLALAWQKKMAAVLPNGLHLFPVKFDDKSQPLLKDYLSKASADPEQIKRWHKFWTKKLGHEPWYGIAPGLSGLVFADIDTKPGKVGQATFDTLDMLYGWPDTMISGSPSGGRHRWYVGQHLFHVGSANTEHQHIDFAQYIILPGCKKSDGTGYTLERNIAPAPAPSWFYEIAKSAARVKDTPQEFASEPDTDDKVKWAIEYLTNEAPPAVEGNAGDATALQVGGVLKDAGISVEKAIELVEAHYNPRCEPPWDDGGEAKVRNAYAYLHQNVPGSVQTAHEDFAADPLPPLAADEQTASDRARAERLKRKAEAAAELESHTAEVRQQVKSYKQICEEWVWVAGTKQFVKINYPELRWDKEQFDDAFSYAKGKASKLSKTIFERVGTTMRKVDGMVYKPGLPKFCMVGPTSNFNLYEPSDIVSASGDTSIFDKHIDYLIPNKGDRKKFLNWWAWKLQNIGKKQKHALLLFGRTPGTGKSFIADLMERIYGKDNVSPVGPDELSGQFNEWALKCNLVVIEELRALEKTQIKNKLHPMITQTRIKLNDKNVKRFTLENCFGFFMMTNEPAAIKLDNSDRRYLVIETKALPKPHSYYVRLFKLLDDPKAIGAIKYQLEHRDLEGYSGEGRAPETTAKLNMIEAGSSDIEQWMTMHAGEYPLTCTVISLDDILKIMPGRISARSGIYNTISDVLERKFKGGKLGQVRVNGERPYLWGINGGLAAFRSKIHPGELVPHEKIAEAYTNQHNDFAGKAADTDAEDFTS